MVNKDRNKDKDAFIDPEEFVLHTIVMTHKIINYYKEKANNSLHVHITTTVMNRSILEAFCT